MVDGLQTLRPTNVAFWGNEGRGASDEPPQTMGSGGAAMGSDGGQACPGISSARPGWFGILKIARVMWQRRDGRNLTDCATWHRGDLTDCATWHYRLLWNYGRQCGIINK